MFDSVYYFPLAIFDKLSEINSSWAEQFAVYGCKEGMTDIKRYERGQEIYRTVEFSLRIDPVGDVVLLVYTNMYDHLGQMQTLLTEDEHHLWMQVNI